MISVVIGLLIFQGMLGAFDTIYHHELRAALPQQTSTALELRIHAIRSVLYGVVFAGLAWFVWGGVWLLVLGGIVLIEIALTFWDFIVEDRTRLLPGSERVLHTVLAISGGATFGILCLLAPAWWALPNGLHPVTHGWQSLVLSVFALGVTASGIRDALASRQAAFRQSHGRRFHFGRAPQTVLVTGGTGFIGQELCRALLADGHTLILLVRNPINAAYLFRGRTRCVTDLNELHPDSRVDVVINLAGERILGQRWTAARKQRLIESRVGTTAALVNWVANARRKPRLMISASAVGFYGVQRPGDQAALAEDSPGQPIFVSELCRQWESAAYAVTFVGVPLAILRFGVVFGRQGALPAMRLPFLAGVGGPVGEGRQMMSWVHIHDLLGVVAHLMTRPDSVRAAGVYNVTSPQPVTQKTFAQSVGKVWRRPSFMRLPGFILRAVLGEQATLMLDGQRAVPVRLMESGYRFRFPDILSALQDLRR